jgi:hypothetical protein
VIEKIQNQKLGRFLPEQAQTHNIFAAESHGPVFANRPQPPGCDAPSVFAVMQPLE